MKSVTQVSLGGIVINLENDASVQVDAYLKKQARKLKDNPDKDEILADIEMSIASKIKSMGIKDDMAATSSHIKDILSELGDVEDAKDDDPKTDGPKEDWKEWLRKPLTRSHDDRMIFGIAGSIAKQFNIASVWVRLAMIVLTVITDGFFFMLYIIVGVLTTSTENVKARSAAESVEAHDQKKTDKPIVDIFRVVNKVIKFVLAIVIGAIFIGSLIMLTIVIINMASSSSTDVPLIGFDRSATSYILMASGLGLFVWLFGSSLYGIIRSSQNNPIKSTPRRQIMQISIFVILITSSISALAINQNVIHEWQARNPDSHFILFDDDGRFCSDERSICAGGELLKLNFDID